MNIYINKTSIITSFLLIFMAFSANAQAPVAPTANQQAPAVEAPKPAWMNYKNSYTGGGRIDTPHITDTEVVSWAQNAVSDMFALSPETYAGKLKDFKSNYFAKSGWKKYAQFLKDSGTLEMITNKGYSVTAIVRHAPAIINEKSIENKYHWVMKMDTSISFSVVTSKGETRTVKTGNYILYIDIERVAENKNEFNIAVGDIRLDPDMSGDGY